MVGGMCARTLDEANTNTAEDPLDLVRIDDDETGRWPDSLANGVPAHGSSMNWTITAPSLAGRRCLTRTRRCVAVSHSADRTAVPAPFATIRYSCQAGRGWHSMAGRKLQPGPSVSSRKSMSRSQHAP